MDRRSVVVTAALAALPLACASPASSAPGWGPGSADAGTMDAGVHALFREDRLFLWFSGEEVDEHGATRTFRIGLATAPLPLLSEPSD